MILKNDVTDGAAQNPLGKMAMSEICGKEK